MVKIPPNTSGKLFWPDPSKCEEIDADDPARAMENYRKGSEATLAIEQLRARRNGITLDTGPRELVIRDLSTVVMKSINWLWKGWIPQGYITIWAGETGAGKSTVLADVTARITTGAPWPGEQPNDCLLYTSPSPRD